MLKYMEYDQACRRCSENCEAVIYTIRGQQTFWGSHAGLIRPTQRISKHSVEFAASITDNATQAIHCACDRSQTAIDDHIGIRRTRQAMKAYSSAFTRACFEHQRCVSTWERFSLSGT
jgi:hypothetical protein